MEELELGLVVIAIVFKLIVLSRYPWNPMCLDIPWKFLLPRYLVFFGKHLPAAGDKEAMFLELLAIEQVAYSTFDG